jgi:hypothetical protein
VSNTLGLIFFGLVIFVLLSLVPNRYSRSRLTASERFVRDRLSWGTFLVQSVLYLILIAGWVVGLLGLVFIAVTIVYAIGAHILAAFRAGAISTRPAARRCSSAFPKLDR